MYKTFTEWKNGNWLENGEPRKEAYTRDELLLVEMGWKYGFDAGKAQQADRIADLEKQLEEKNKPPTKPDTLMELQTVKFCGNLKNQCHGYTTPQTKPLSDADIQQISHRYHYTYNPDYVGFARAIEERHGIK